MNYGKMMTKPGWDAGGSELLSGQASRNWKRAGSLANSAAEGAARAGSR